MIIDAHTHAQKTRTVYRPNGSSYAVPEELIAMMDERGIDKAVLLCRMSPEKCFRYVTPEDVLEMTALHPDRFIPFCNLDPRMMLNNQDSDFRPLLQYYKQAGCRGVGEYVPNMAMDDPLMMNVFHQVEELELPLTIHIAPAIGGFYGCYDDRGLLRLEKVLTECPRLIILGHSQPFWSEISADVTEGTRNSYPKGKVTPGRIVQLLKEYPNLYGDLSANSGYNAISRDPEFGLRFLDEFQDRLLFATDICYTPQETPLVGFFKEIKEKNLIPTDVYEKITWKNADRLFKLGLQP